MSRSLDRITMLETFVRIADAGSISSAARDLGLSQPSVSRQLAELENRLQSQLIRRTTHSLALTEAGQDLLNDARQILDQWSQLEDKHLHAERQIQGKLKVIAPVALGQQHLVQMACRFQADFPGVTLVWDLEDHAIRFAEAGCDCWIKIGPVPDDTLIVRKVGSVQRLLVGSAEFARLQGLPQTPGRAKHLPLIALDPYEGGRLLLERGKRSASIEPPVRMRTNNIVALRESVRMGLGMAVLPEWFIADELKSNVLVDLLPGWCAPSFDLHIAYLPAKHQPRRLRAFIEYVESQIPGIPGIDAP